MIQGSGGALRLSPQTTPSSDRGEQVRGLNPKPHPYHDCRGRGARSLAVRYRPSPPTPRPLSHSLATVARRCTAQVHPESYQNIRMGCRDSGSACEAVTSAQSDNGGEQVRSFRSIVTGARAPVANFARGAIGPLLLLRCCACNPAWHTVARGSPRAQDFPTPVSVCSKKLCCRHPTPATSQQHLRQRSCSRSSPAASLQLPPVSHGPPAWPALRCPRWSLPAPSLLHSAPTPPAWRSVAGSRQGRACTLCCSVQPRLLSARKSCGGRVLVHNQAACPESQQGRLTGRFLLHVSRASAVLPQAIRLSVGR